MLNETEFMRLLLIPGHYRGFRYLLDCVNLVVCDEELLYPMRGKLYRIIAQRYETSVDCVKRDIKTVIEIWWKKGDRSVLDELRPGETAAPKNKECIHLLAAYLKRSVAQRDL